MGRLQLALGILALFVFTIYFSSAPLCINAITCEFEFSGYVLDLHSSSPVSNCSIKFFIKRYTYYYYCDFIGEAITDENGFYNVSLKIAFPSPSLPRELVILIYRWNNSLNAIDYAPIIVYYSVRADMERNILLNFTLCPAVSIYFRDEFLYVNFSEPADRVSFRVLVGDEYPLKNCSILEYGYVSGALIDKMLRVIGVPENLVVLPVGYPVNVEISGLFVERFEVPVLWFRRHIVRIWRAICSVLLYDDWVKFNESGVFECSILNATVRYSLKLLREYYQLISSRVEEASKAGFYTTSIEVKLGELERLINRAGDLFLSGNFIESHSLLREAYISLLDLDSYVDWMYKEARMSIDLLIIFFMIGSIFISFMLTEKLILKALLSLIFSLIFLYLLSMSYPLAPQINFNTVPIIIAPPILTLTIHAFMSIMNRYGLLPAILNLSDILSYAKRNIRRRKIRSIIFFTSFLFFTMGLIALTSTSIEVNLLTSVSSNELKLTGISVDRNVPPVFVKACFTNLEAEDNPYGLPLPMTVLEMLNCTGKVFDVSYRAETRAKVKPYGRLYAFTETGIDANKYANISGMISFTSNDPMYMRLNEYLVEGSMPVKENEVVVSRRTAEYLNVHAGDRVLFMGRILVVSGIIDDWSIKWLREFSGRPFLPYKMVLTLKGEDGNPSIYEAYVCSPDEVLIISWELAGKMKKMFITRIFAYLKCGDDELISIGRTVALGGGSLVVSIFTSSKQINMLLSQIFSFTGFEIFIPAIIIVLNAALTSAATLYERRREATVLSSIGCSPRDLLIIFLFESLLLGTSAGTLGYISGLSLYRLMAEMSSISVKPKVSFLWVLVAILISTLCACLGSIFILRSTLIVVPSKLWSIRGRRVSSAVGDVWIYDVPVKLRWERARDFIEFIASKLKRYPLHVDERIRVVDLRRVFEDKEAYELEFTYDVGFGSASRNTSRNILRVWIENGECKVLLQVKSYGSSAEKHALRTARLIRSIAMEWS